MGESGRTDQRPIQCGVGLGELATQLAGGLLCRLGGVTGGIEVGTQIVVGLLARPDETPQSLDLGASGSTSAAVSTIVGECTQGLSAA